jgi:hypothetical protein
MRNEAAAIGRCRFGLGAESRLRLTAAAVVACHALASSGAGLALPELLEARLNVADYLLGSDLTGLRGVLQVLHRDVSLVAVILVRLLATTR